MFKKAFIVLALILFCSSVFSLRLIEPLSKVISEEDSFVGTVAVGNELEMIFSKELTDKYSSVEVISSFPEGFSVSSKVEKESIKVFVRVPEEAVFGDYSLSLLFSGESQSESADVFFTVVSDSLDVSPASTAQQSVFVDSPAEFKLFFVNNTDSDAFFEIVPELSPNWIYPENIFYSPSVGASIHVLIEKRSATEKSFFVYPRIQGSKEFKVKVYFENDVREFSFRVNALPTIKSKLDPIIQAFPFYSISLIPAYIIQAFASLFL